ncbi:MAG: protein kinase [Planctomycetaceae bacterium]|nr:protein kinase [Planctomycetaceae bacterium]MCB9949529.1 protein kinase [Planctomycetaceae bacterium]
MNSTPLKSSKTTPTQSSTNDSSPRDNAHPELTTVTPVYESHIPPGTRISQYVVAAKIATGATGTAYLATDLANSNRTVVLKQCHRETLERHILAAINHPHIPHLLNSLTSTEFGPIIILSYAGSVSLRTYLHATPIETRLDRLIVAANQIASAIQYLHTKGIIHLDIKPNHILTSATGVPSLIDFGAARPPISNTVVSFTKYYSPSALQFLDTITASQELQTAIDHACFAKTLLSLLKDVELKPTQTITEDDYTTLHSLALTAAEDPATTTTAYSRLITLVQDLATQIQSQNAPSPSKQRSTIPYALLSFLILILFAALPNSHTPPSPVLPHIRSTTNAPQSLLELQKLLRTKKLSDARKLVPRVLEENPDNSNAATLAVGTDMACYQFLGVTPRLEILDHMSRVNTDKLNPLILLDTSLGYAIVANSEADPARRRALIASSDTYFQSAVAQLPGRILEQRLKQFDSDEICGHSQIAQFTTHDNHITSH